MTDLATMEKLVDRYVEQGKTEDAVQTILDLITRYAKQRSFSKAEALRDRLFEVDASALIAIVKAADVIDEEKSKAMDKEHMELWAEMYAGLNVDESNTLHYAMRELIVETNQVVFKEGEQNSNLYFVDKGELKLTYSHGDDEFLIKIIKAGEIAGQSMFFSHTAFNTATMIALTSAKLKYLDKDVLSKWENDSPKVLSRLRDHSAKFITVQDLLKNQGLDRRVHRRVEMSGNGMVQVLNSAGEPAAKAVKVSLADVSSGGLAFYLKFSKQETARMLLGRTMLIKFPVVQADGNKDLTKKCVIVGVRYHGYSDYSVHVKFEKTVSDKLVNHIEKTMPRKPGG